MDYLYHVEKNHASHGMMFVGGAFNGVSDALAHKYSSTVFYKSPANNQFWNPQVSWENKYRDWPIDDRPAYFGSTTFLAWTTDGWHMTKTGQLKSMQVAMVLYKPEKEIRKWWWPVADVFVTGVFYSAGFHLSQSIVINR
jgi:hypothetical protein